MPNPLINRPIVYSLPKAENLLRLANYNIVMNRRYGHDATLTFPALVSRAYMIVNETGVLQHKNYPAGMELPELQ